MKDIECPYCEEWNEINHDAGFGYAEGVKHQMECDSCSKTFVFETSISFHYDPEKADCLNVGGEHVWKLQRVYPKCFSKMECIGCGEERELTEEERVTFEVGSVEEYLKELEK